MEDYKIIFGHFVLLDIKSHFIVQVVIEPFLEPLLSDKFVVD
jgi:hypothetical protein